MLDASNVIAQVDFLLDGASLGAITVTPYQIDWVATSGNHTLRVQATDVTGATRYSDIVQFSVPLDVTTPFDNTRAQGYTWGNGANYRTGQGSAAALKVPAQLGTEADWAWLSAGYNHGVGLKLQHLMGQELSGGMDALRAVKRALDPKGIMNPGKMGLT